MNAARLYGGSAAQAALGVVQKVFMLAFSLSLGIGQGYQPVVGYNYSSKRFDRVRSAYLFTLGFSTSIMVVFASVCAIFAPHLMHMFSLSPEATEIGTLTLRLQCLCMPLLPLNFMASVTYQVVGSKAIAAVLILPNVLQLFGVQCSQAVSDVFAFFFAIPFTFLFFKQIKDQEKLLEKERQVGQVCVE